MTHIWGALPVIVVGAAAAWLFDSAGLVVAVQIVAVLLIAFVAMLWRWSNDIYPK